LSRYTNFSMNPSVTEIPPAPRVAKELLKSNGFLLARMGIGFKTQAIALFEQEGFEHYDYSVLCDLAEGVPETQATIAATLNVDPRRLVRARLAGAARSGRPSARPAGPPPPRGQHHAPTASATSAASRAD
jgi:hypothetical protein